MEYFKYRVDSSGYTYSIDNLVLEYIIKNHCDVISYLQGLCDKYKLEVEYYEKLNLPYCSKYQYYNNHIHLCNGIYLMIGKYDTYSDLSQTHNIFPVVKLEINPNKHAKKPVFKELLNFLHTYKGDCTLKRYDFAIDIKCKLQDIEVFGSRKEKGLYKGTRTFGQRNKDGYLKIYDKAQEQDLDYDLTRIEYTIINQKREHQKKGFNFQVVYIKDNAESSVELSGVLKTICKLYTYVLNMGGDPSELLDDLDKRTKKKVLEGLSGMGYKPIYIDLELLNDLLNEINTIFGVDVQKFVYEDSEGFLKCDNFDIPFD